MREGDRQKFVKLANRRVPNAIKAIDLIGNLSNRSNYSYTDRDAAAIIRELKRAVAECESRFNGKETRATTFQLDS